MKAIRNILTKISWGTFKPVDLVFPNDVVRGDVHLCDDDAGRVIVMDEISVRAMLHRVGPLCAVKVDQTTISVDAWAMAEAIDQRYEPIHQPIPNKIAAAPLRDRLALRRLRNKGYALAGRCCDARAILTVPSSVAGWIDIRHNKALASLNQMVGWEREPICA